MKILCALLAVLFLLILVGGAVLAGYSDAIQSFDVSFLVAIMLTLGWFGFGEIEATKLAFKLSDGSDFILSNGEAFYVSD